MNLHLAIPLVLALAAAAPACGQARLTLSAPDSLAFLCSIDGEEANRMRVTDLTLTGLEPGKHTVRMVFANSSSIEQQVTLRTLTHSTYQPAFLKGSWKLALASDAAYTPATPTGLPVEHSPDSAPAAANVVEESGACTQPLSPEEFEAVKAEMQAVRLQSVRLERLQALAGSRCLRADQLRFLMSLLELEDHKIRLLEAATGHVFDPRRLATLPDDFFLEKNRERVRTLLAVP